MITMMPISHQQAFTLARNHYNWAWACRMNPWYWLPPMFMDGITPVGLYTVSEFKLRRITIKGPVKTVEETESLGTSLIAWDRQFNADTFYAPMTARTTWTSETGLYEYYVKLSNGAEYISEPFWLMNCSGTTPAVVGDYSGTAPEDDYNDDYFI